jgi:hypothetical protein
MRSLYGLEGSGRFANKNVSLSTLRFQNQSARKVPTAIIHRSPFFRCLRRNSGSAAASPFSHAGSEGGAQITPALDGTSYLVIAKLSGSALPSIWTMRLA